MPWSCQGFEAAPIEPPPITAVLFNSHVSTCPVALLYQRRSLLPSPLKSPVCAIVQGFGAKGYTGSKVLPAGAGEIAMYGCST